MHYYQFHVGDFIRDASHLDLVEDAIYRRLLDLYYTTEKPIQKDLKSVSRIIRAKGKDQKIKEVLEEFFYLDSDGWHNTRADEEIKKYQSFAIMGKKGAKKRWKKDSPPIASPLAPLIATNNHKPLTINQPKTWREGM